MRIISNLSAAITSRPSADMIDHPAFPVIDGHVDLVYGMMRGRPDTPFGKLSEGPVTIDALRAGGVKVVVNAFYCEDRWNGPDTAAENLGRLMAYARKYLHPLSMIADRDGLDGCFQGRSATGVLFMLENADALLDLEPSFPRKSGLRLIGLTHAGSNRIGDGNGVKHPNGLTGVGKRLLGVLAEQGCAVDLAHLSDPCFRDLNELFPGPLVSTHTGLRKFFDIPRNLGEEQVAAIAQRQGIIGITVNPEMLSPDGEATLEHVFAHIDFLVQRHGPQYVALGSDFLGFDPTNRGLEDVSRFPVLAESLVRHGYPPDAVSAVMGGNWYRFHRELLPSAADSSL